MKEFGATNYMVKKSRTVMKEKGILGLYDKPKGKKLKTDIVNAVIDFYQNDENSRICPGKKDSISIRNKDGEKEKRQKRLVLSNLNELYISWKKAHPEEKIGFSTFAKLRPQWCILAGSSGTHSVCVCVYHQNPKLMVRSCLNFSVEDLMAICVCSTDYEKCMMGSCKECPGQDLLTQHLLDCDEIPEEITYQQWVCTDRAKLTTFVEPKVEFIEKLSSQIMKLTRHSYTAKAQAKYMTDLKASIQPKVEIIVQGDFAENFSYVVQDEVQSFHWNNRQATLHPFVIYRRLDNETLEHKNVCIVSDIMGSTIPSQFMPF